MVSFYSLKIKQVYNLQKLPRNFWVNRAKNADFAKCSKYVDNFTD